MTEQITAEFCRDAQQPRPIAYKVLPISGIVIQAIARPPLVRSVIHTNDPNAYISEALGFATGAQLVIRGG